MATALAKLKSEWYVLKKDVGNNKPARFHLKPLSGFGVMELMEHLIFDKANNMIVNARAHEVILSRGLIGWENFLDKEDNEVKYSANNEANMDRLDWDDIKEISTRILDNTYVNDEDKKK